MSEWSKVHDWKSCKVKSLRGFESPSLRFGNRFRAACGRPTPPGPGGSNGKWIAGETRGICSLFYYLSTFLIIISMYSVFIGVSAVSIVTIRLSPTIMSLAANTSSLNMPVAK